MRKTLARLRAAASVAMSKLRAWVSAVWRLVRDAVGLSELHVYGGLALVAAGLWQLSRPVAMIAVGVVLLALGLLPLLPRQRRPRRV